MRVLATLQGGAGAKMMRGTACPPPLSNSQAEEACHSRSRPMSNRDVPLQLR